MMRTSLRLFSLLVLLGAALWLTTPGAAQDEGCSQSEPCVLEINVDETGFPDANEWNVTVGDWYVINVFNLDIGSDHTVTVEGYDITLTASFAEEAASEPRAFDILGDFFLTDYPTEMEAVLHVIEYDVVAFEDGGDDEQAGDPEGGEGGDKTAGPTTADSPSVGVFAAGLALVAVATIARARR